MPPPTKPEAPARGLLSRERVLHAAVALADENGIAGSVRRSGSRRCRSTTT